MLVGLSFPAVMLQLLFAYVIYYVLLCVYRITFHPLAKFPGPKKAAASRLYAMSWDIPHKSYVKEFTKWHDEYDSAIVRIEPNHLHFRDIDAYNEIFKVGSRFTRDPALYSFPFTQGGLFNKLTHQEGKPHRDMYNNYFSRAAVQKLEPVIQLHLSQFMQKLDEAAQKSSPVDLSWGFKCLTADTVMRYQYDKPFNALLSPNFENDLIMQLAGFFDTAAVGWYAGATLNPVIAMIRRLPRSWIAGNKPMASALQILDSCKSRVSQLRREGYAQKTPHIFQTALRPDQKKNHPVLDDDGLAADALTFFTAGTDTTANTLTYGLWYLIKNPEIMSKLRSELESMLPYNTSLESYSKSWVELESNDYFRAFVKEALRLSFGVPGKIPRIVPPEGAILAGKFIPGGTAVSSTTYAYYTNDNYFSEALKFKPERWLDISKNGGKDPEKYFINFSRGSRACIGLNLAYAELFYTFAYVVRNFDFELFETTDADMEWHDLFVVCSNGHLKVKVTRTVD